MRRRRCRACFRRRKDIGGMCRECGWRFRSWARNRRGLEVFRHGVRDDGRKLAFVVESVDIKNEGVAVAFDEWTAQRTEGT